MNGQSISLFGTLQRQSHSDQGTEGILTIGIFSCFTIELPWRKNQRSISCIPEGKYQCVSYYSRTFGRVYLVQDVPDRSSILLHYGNWAGDRTMGYKTNSEGCILVGTGRGEIHGQRAVANSRTALRRMMEYTKGLDFTLLVTS